MEERNLFDAHAWYQPNDPVEEPTDLFEEAGLYKLRSREELLAMNTPKKRSWVLGRAGLGVTVYDLEGGDETYPDGMLVNSVTKGSDAEKQGLQAGDVITAIDGKAATDIDVLRGVIEAKGVGGTVTVTVWRDGETLELTIELMDQNDM